jgi:hypothetical protein
MVQEGRAGVGSRLWGWVALLGFAVHLGAAVYEAALVAPLWSNAPPESVAAWAALDRRPDSSTLFLPLVALLLAATLAAWLPALRVRGLRRWWLTASLGAAAALAWISIDTLRPLERALFGAAALGDPEAAVVVAQAGDWVRAAALRLLVLAVGSWTALAAHVAASRAVAAAPRWSVEASEREGRPRRGPASSPSRSRLDDLRFDDDDVDPRELWRRSGPRGRRAAEK